MSQIKNTCNSDYKDLSVYMSQIDLNEELWNNLEFEILHIKLTECWEAPLRGYVIQERAGRKE